jgi:hypothetical protein
MISLWKMRWVEHTTRKREIKNLYKILVRKPESDRTLTKPRPNLEGNIKNDLKEMVGVCKGNIVIVLN